MIGQHSHNVLDHGLDQQAIISITKVLYMLKESCWYWGSRLTSDEAKRMLKAAPSGTFLLRDSSNERYLFALTVKTDGGVTNLRLNYCKGRFQLESNDDIVSPKLPSFDCVVQLVNHYTQSKRRILYCSKSSKTSNKRKAMLKVELAQPFYNNVPSLQHLCRRAVHSQMNSDTLRHLPMANTLMQYIMKYPHSI
ncbi:Suppressor of cytokine signaling 2 [Trichoplax sp. H2]|nr:Suppressor of cytokine signaling 2 [Trichoplax sp. H2]|eukprot:RDD39430.1 Suppressor of cytokine signaling 2 [Trichoplax sp. H2]